MCMQIMSMEDILPLNTSCSTAAGIFYALLKENASLRNEHRDIGEPTPRQVYQCMSSLCTHAMQPTVPDMKQYSSIKHSWMKLTVSSCKPILPPLELWSRWRHLESKFPRT